MKNGNFTSCFGLSVVMLLGVMLVGLGISTVLHPEIMARYGLSVANAHGKSTLMSVIGGAELGLGMFLLLGQMLRIDVMVRLQVILFLFLGLLSARLVSVGVFFETLPPIFFRELLLELCITTIIALGVYLSRAEKDREQI